MSLGLCGLIFSLLLAILALLLDAWLAEPRRFHPLVGFGRWADAVQRRLNPQTSRWRWLRRCNWPLLHVVLQIVLGGLAVALVVAPLFYFFWMGLKLLAVYSAWLAAAVEVVLLYVCIGGRSLQQHVQAVADALAQHDLATARQKLSWIVSRETQLLNEQQIAQASVETTLENSSDAVFASLFWFALGGAAFSLLHRWLNTLDAMWGYKNEQFLYFGRIAARLDDAMNYIPARLTALCFVVLSPRRQKTASGAAGNLAWYCWRTQARQCASPNGGVVMTAGAGALNCRLSDGAYYHGHWQAKPPMGCGAEADGDDIAAALTLVKRAVGVFLLAWLLLGLALLGLEFTGSAYV